MTRRRSACAADTIGLPVAGLSLAVLGIRAGAIALAGVAVAAGLAGVTRFADPLHNACAVGEDVGAPMTLGPRGWVGDSMKRTAVVIVLAAAPLLGCAAAVPAATGSATLGAAAAVTAPGSATSGSAAVDPAAVHCHSANGLPDRHCTPGATYAKVTQQDIRSTICKSGWTKKVRPPESYTEKLKREQIAEYGYGDTRLGDYEEDHLIPLEIGGSPRSVRNLWPEYDGGKIPNPKDKVENALRTAVCDGRVKLAPAQRAIARDWKTAEKVLGISRPAPSPSPTRTAAGLSCAASVSNSQPADYSTVDVYVRTAAGAGVTTVAHYKTTNNQKSATANSQGRATIAYYISGATKGYRVVVDVTVTHASATAHCSTSVTPA
ncbi:MAG TPA: hypothetical protein VMV92_06465 [Streptosporangiaceae bacterium]|nr:hypothetical protein [Streptosporangiaceae bacterium]